jgi:hypothetical protein
MRDRRSVPTAFEIHSESGNAQILVCRQTNPGETKESRTNDSPTTRLTARRPIADGIGGRDTPLWAGTKAPPGVVVWGLWGSWGIELALRSCL